MCRAALEVAQLHRERLGLGHELRRPEEILPWIRYRCQASHGRNEVLGVENTRNVVESIPVDDDAGVLAAPDHLYDVVPLVSVVEGNDVQAWRHDIPDRSLTQGEHSHHEISLRGSEAAFAGPPVGKDCSHGSLNSRYERQQRTENKGGALGGRSCSRRHVRREKTDCSGKSFGNHVEETH